MHRASNPGGSPLKRNVLRRSNAGNVSSPPPRTDRDGGEASPIKRATTLMAGAASSIEEMDTNQASLHGNLSPGGSPFKRFLPRRRRTFKPINLPPPRNRRGGKATTGSPITNVRSLSAGTSFGIDEIDIKKNRAPHAALRALADDEDSDENFGGSSGQRGGSSPITNVKSVMAGTSFGIVKKNRAPHAALRALADDDDSDENFGGSSGQSGGSSTVNRARSLMIGNPTSPGSDNSATNRNHAPHAARRVASPPTQEDDDYSDDGHGGCCYCDHCVKELSVEELRKRYINCRFFIAVTDDDFDDTKDNFENDYRVGNGSVGPRFAFPKIPNSRNQAKAKEAYMKKPMELLESVAEYISDEQSRPAWAALDSHCLALIWNLAPALDVRKQEKAVSIPKPTKSHFLLGYLHSRLLQEMKPLRIKRLSLHQHEISRYSSKHAGVVKLIVPTSSLSAEVNMLIREQSHYLPCKSCTDKPHDPNSITWQQFRCSECNHQRLRSAQKSMSDMRRAVSQMLSRAGLEELAVGDQVSYVDNNDGSGKDIDNAVQEEELRQMLARLLIVASLLESRQRISSLFGTKSDEATKKAKNQLLDAMATERTLKSVEEEGRMSPKECFKLAKEWSKDKVAHAKGSKMIYIRAKEQLVLTTCDYDEDSYMELVYSLLPQRVLGSLGSCSVKVYSYGIYEEEVYVSFFATFFRRCNVGSLSTCVLLHCVRTTKKKILWLTQYGTPADQWVKKLQTMNDKNAAECFRNMAKSVCRSLTLLNGAVNITHFNLKASNMVVVKETDGKRRLQMGINGRMKFEQPKSDDQFLLIDMKRSIPCLMLPTRGPSSPEINSVHQLLGIKGPLDGRNDDTFALARFFSLVANKGFDNWTDGKNCSAPCPDEFHQLFMHASNVHAMGYGSPDCSDQRLRMSQGLWEHIVMTHTKNQWVVKVIMEMCPGLQSLDIKLMSNGVFRDHIAKYALDGGSEWAGLRSCSAFASEKAAIHAFMCLLHPDPMQRILPEQFLLFLR
ncbi:hypothetical protein MPSEU_001009000 [Mayamaea pseudoterrestris]|nr:hypothetical protein MPSEU_001009000 [Mayamaea pseudoterrestris]